MHWVKRLLEVNRAFKQTTAKLTTAFHNESEWYDTIYCGIARSEFGAFVAAQLHNLHQFVLH